MGPWRRRDHELDELDDLTDDDAWDATADAEPAPDQAEVDAHPSFTPPVPTVHDVEPLPELDDDRPSHRSRRRLPRRWRSPLVGGLALLIVVVVTAGGEHPPSPVTAPTGQRAAPTADPAPTAARQMGRPSTSVTAAPLRARPRPRTRTRTIPRSSTRGPSTPAPAPASTPTRTTPAPAGPWSEEFFRP